MYDKYLSDYYRRKITIRQICDEENIEHHVFYRYLRSVGEIPFRKHYPLIDTGIAELDEKLKQIYNGIIQRCNGKEGTPKGYHDLEYLDIRQWVDFCNSRRSRLCELWRSYVKNGRKYKYAVSVDRIDDNQGYLVDNMVFAPLGFNAWKRNIRPIKVTKSGEQFWFLSCEEGSRKLGISHSSVGAVLIGSRKINFDVEETSVEEVLNQTASTDLERYYRQYIA